MELKELLLLLSSGSAIALTIPDDHDGPVPRAASSAIAPSTTGTSPLPVAAAIDSFNTTSASLNSSSSKLLHVIGGPVDLCMLGLIDCVHQEDDPLTQGPLFTSTNTTTLSQNVTTSSRKRSPSAHQKLGKRGRENKPWDNSDFMLEAASYYVPSEMVLQKDVPTATFRYKDKNSWDPTVVNDKDVSHTSDEATEHNPELQTGGMFLADTAGDDEKLKASIIENWKSVIPEKNYEALMKIAPTWGKALIEAAKGAPITFDQFFMHSFGSKLNPTANVLLEANINSFKEHAWAQKQIMDPDKFKQLMEEGINGQRAPNEYRTVLMDSEGVFSYLKDPEVATRMKIIFQEQFSMLQNFKELTGKEIKDGQGKAVQLEKRYEEFTTRLNTKINENAKEWFEARVKETLKAHDERTAELEEMAKELENKKTDKATMKKLEQARAKAEKAYEAIQKEHQEYEEYRADIEKRAQESGTKANSDKIRKEDGTTWQQKSQHFADLGKKLVEAGNELVGKTTAVFEATPEGIENLLNDLATSRKEVQTRGELASETFTCPDWTKAMTTEQRLVADKISAAREQRTGGKDGNPLKRPDAPSRGPSGKQPDTKAQKGPDGAHVGPATPGGAEVGSLAHQGEPLRTVPDTFKTVPIRGGKPGKKT